MLCAMVVALSGGLFFFFPCCTLFSLSFSWGWGRYLDELMKLKAQARAENNEFITWNDIQACVDQVNLVVQEEHESE